MEFRESDTLAKASETMPLKLPEMTAHERDILEFMKEINPQSLYGMGFEELGDKVFLNSRENIEYARRKVRELKKSLAKKEVLARKYLDSIENFLEWDEPAPDIGMISETLATHLIKEGMKPERFKILIEQLSSSVEASLSKFQGKNYPAAIRILVQYQVLGAIEILNILQKETNDQDLLEKISTLRSKVEEYRKRFAVEGFTEGSFEQVIDLLKKNGPDLGREKFYLKALKYGFDYRETPAELERKALAWIKEDLPRMLDAVKKLSKVLGCEATPEAVNTKLRSMPGVRPEEALKTTLRIRPIVQAFAAESFVGINPKYNTTVVETPPYLTAILPTGAAQGFDALTDHPSQRFYITTDPKRAPPGGFADLVNLLVHEEYGHCLHFSNTAAGYAAKAGIIELLPSLHVGTTSEGLAFQRELEFFEALKRLDKKNPKKYTESEKKYVELNQEFGGFKQTLLEMEFTTYKERIIRFLRVLGDSRINSGKQNLLDFLAWAEKRTGLSQRTVFFQIFPAHEGIYPGYATCYAVVGQEIKAIQQPFKDDSEKMVKFNAYACSMGYPARSIYSKKLKEFANKLIAKKSYDLALRKSRAKSKKSPSNGRKSKGTKIAG